MTFSYLIKKNPAIAGFSACGGLFYNFIPHRRSAILAERFYFHRKCEALSYEKMKLPAEEISDLVGYSEVNAFSRAFKSWTGITVTEYRKREFGI